MPAKESEVRINGPTPNGGDYSIAYWRDAKGLPVPEEEATSVEIVEFSADGSQLFRTYGDVNAMTEQSSDRQDAFPMVKQKLNIGGHIIAVTHNPGDQRFEYGLPMRDRYGYLEGTYGNAPDGKAFDFYINPGYQVNDEMPLVFMVSQTTPDGEMDEPKFMVGYPDLSSAREAHAYHAGMDRSGLVEPMDWDDLDVLYEDEDEEEEDEDYEDGEDEDEEEEGY